RKRQAEEEAEKKRQAEEEAERKRQAEEEAERKRQAVEEAEKKRQAEEEAKKKRQVEKEAEARREAGVNIHDSVKAQESERDKGARFLKLLSSRAEDLESYVIAAKAQILNSCLSEGATSTTCRDALSHLQAAVSSLTVAIATLSEELGVEYEAPEVPARKGYEAGQEATEALGSQLTTEEEAMVIELRGLWTWVGTALLIAAAGFGRGMRGTSKSKDEKGSAREDDGKRREVDQRGGTQSTSAEKPQDGATPDTALPQGADRHSAPGLVRRAAAANAEPKTSPPAPMKHSFGGPPAPGAGAPSPLLFGAAPARPGVTGAAACQPSQTVLLNQGRNGSSPGGPPSRLGHSISSADRSAAAEAAKGENTDFSDELRNPFLQRWS
ncbi:uncharacterized protein Tco025E_05194, partial [Trypanosoma conorhini]